MSSHGNGPIGNRPTWLLVGASGRVGRLVRAGWRIAPPHADMIPQFRACGDCGLRWSPLDGPGALADWCAAHGRIDAMIVLAGIVPARKDADLADDARITEACLSAADATGVPHCLVASSSSVYGPGDGTPLREDDDLRPVSNYGRAKIATEAACLRWRQRGLAVTVLRIGNVAGADALLGQDRVRDGREVVLDRFPGGGGPVRSYIDPVTLSSVFGTLAVADRLPPVLNVAAPGEVPMSDLLDAAALPWRWQPAPSGALQRLVLDCGRLAAIHAFPADAVAPEHIVAGWRKAAA